LDDGKQGRGKRVSPSLEEKLIAAAPSLYREGLSYGFQCGDGWFELLLDLSRKLEPTGAIAMQVKEKFGALRFYAGNLTESGEKWIADAERESAKTCEDCGAACYLRDQRRWLRTLCDDCNAVM
jgi:hypothetical protein